MKDFFQSSEDEAKEYLSRYRLLYGIVVVCSLLIAGRLWQLQIMQGTELRQNSEKNRVKESKLPAPRGLFLDRENRVLVDNLPGFDASISPQYAKKLDETSEIVGRVLAMHIRDSAVLDSTKNYIDTPALKLLARMHGTGWYTRTSDLFEMPRIKVEDWKKR